jgi:Calx-beta domain
MRRSGRLVSLTLSLLGPLAAAAPSSAQLLPADRMTTWSPGVTGGIPYRTTVCASLNAATYGNGSQEASGAIQAAIDACPAGQVVQLSAGTFRMNARYALLWKGVTLRGAGPGATTLAKTNGATAGSPTATDPQPVVILGPTRWPSADENTDVLLTADAVKGAMSVTVASAAGIAAGQFVVLDEDNYNAGAFVALPNRNGVPTSIRIFASDRVVWQRHSPSQPEDDPFPGALTWFSRSGRPVNEMKEVASVVGNTINFTTPIHITYRVARQAQLTRYANANRHVKFAGLEDLRVTGGGDGAVRFEAAAYSWVRNIENTNWLGEGVAINHSFRCELRDSYIHDGAWPSPGGGGYALSLAFGSAEVLIENNIILKANKVMVARSSGAGSVVGYNYADDGFINYALDWQEVGVNGSHMVGPHHMLFEGNQSFNYDSDNTHGSSIYHTVFRNHFSGFRRSFTGLGNGRTIGLAYGSYWHSFVGNVQGLPGQMSGWTYENLANGSPGNPWGNQPNIWKLGYEAIHWEQAVDPKVTQTTIREGNFDYVSNQVHWSGAPLTLPNSLYLTAKPLFFGTWTWPWVDAVGATKLRTLPARARYDGVAMPLPALATTDLVVAEGTGNVLSAIFTVTLSAPVPQTVTVAYATANGTATAGADYVATSGTLAFLAGETSKTVTVLLVPDTVDETDETFRLNLSAPVGATVAVSQSVATIDDDDGPRISVAEASGTEGSGASTLLPFGFSLSAASPQAVVVTFQTSDGTAVAGSDYMAASGTITFPPGSTLSTVDVSVNGDLVDEPNETFYVNLSAPVDATLASDTALGRIVDDDGGVITLRALGHGTVRAGDLSAAGGLATTDLYVLNQPPRTSWEVVVDETSGDIGNGQGPAVERIANDLTTVLQPSVPVGPGPARSLRWRNTTSVAADSYVRIRSVACGTDCGADDVYRVRAYETTVRVPRFNLTGGQVTVILVQNTTSTAVSGTAYFWSNTGALLASQSFDLNPRALSALALAGIPALTNQSGTVTITHTGPYGALTGKGVAADTASGATYDSPLTLRER